MNHVVSDVEFRLMMKSGKWNYEQLATWTQGEWAEVPRRPILRFTQDSRSVMEGDVYVALHGDRFDGHNYIQEALQAGAVAVVVNESWFKSQDVNFPCLVVSDTGRALLDLAVHFRELWSSQVVGVTGSVGKTSVKELLADIVSTSGRVSRTLGNYNNQIGVPLSVLAASADDDFGVFELGMNQPDEIGPLADVISPSVAIMTPVGSAHTEGFESLEHIAIEKASLLERVNRKGFCVLSRDLPFYDLFSKKSAASVVTVALSGDADWTGSFQDDVFIINLQGHPVMECRLKIHTDFMARNVLLCTAAACRMGVAMDDIKRVVESFTIPGMRWQRSTWQGVEVINDCYNANPLSMDAALTAFDQMPVEGTRWALLGEMLELGDAEQQAHEDVGARIAALSCSCIAVGRTSPWMMNGLRKAGGDSGRMFEAVSPTEAVQLLNTLLKPGDALLIKASRGIRLESVLEAWQRPEGR